MDARAALVRDIVLAAATVPAAEWYRRAWQDAGNEFRRNPFRAAFGGAGRRLGEAAPPLAAEARVALAQSGLGAPERWGLDMFGRTGLLLRGLETLPEADHVGLVRELLIRGSYREQVALLQSLPLLPAPERFVEIAVDACRTNILDVFEAIAYENRYPARYFPEPNFNQLVVKAMFMGLALARIEGLAGRITQELQRMCADYASERRAASRPVPSDIDLVLT